MSTLLMQLVPSLPIRLLDPPITDVSIKREIVSEKVTSTYPAFNRARTQGVCRVRDESDRQGLVVLLVG